MRAAEWSSTLNQSFRYADKQRAPKGPTLQLTVRTRSLLKGLPDMRLRYQDLVFGVDLKMN